MDYVICDCSSGDAYIKRTLGSPPSPTWYEQVQVQIPAATYTALASLEQTAALVAVNDADPQEDGIFVTADDTSGGSHVFSGGNKNLWTHEAPSNPVAGPFTEDVWHVILVEYDGTDVTWKLDGSTLFNYTLSFSGGATLATTIIGGWLSNATAGEIYWVADYRVGTTPGGTDIDSDDFSGDLSGWTVVGDASIAGSGGGATNTSQDTAIALAGTCSEGTITNVGATDTAEADDPLNTVYGLGVAFSRQVWWKLTNTTGDQAYIRFILKNTSVTNIDLAAAIYIDDPATTVIDTNRSFDRLVDFETLTADATITLGVAVEAGATVWLEVAGDDTEGDGDGWNGTLDLTWQLLAATFYDTPATDESTTPAEFVADLHNWNDGVSTAQPISYCKMGDLHFAAMQETSDLTVWVWSTGGSATEYGILAGGVTQLGESGYGPVHPQLRTDGTNVWLVHFYLTTTPIPCGPFLTVHDAPQFTVAVWYWNGAGFDLLGNDIAQGFEWEEPGSFKRFHQIGRLSAAASSSEVGVLHVMWSEGGVSTVDPATCLVAQSMQRVAYSRWNTTTYDVLGASTVFNDAGFPEDCTPTMTGLLFCTNAFGSPVAFYTPPTNVQFDDGGAGMVYGDTGVEMWSIDESSGAKTTLQTFDYTTIEAGAAHTEFGLNVQISIDGLRQQPQDPYASVDSIFFTIPFTISSISRRPLFVVPADGSAAITVAIPQMDQRLSDVYYDSRVIWVGTDGALLRGFSDSCPSSPSAFGESLHSAFPGIALDNVEFQYDDGDDVFYTLGWNNSNTPLSDVKFAPLKIPILRDYLICSLGSCTGTSGLHVWQRF